MARNGEWSLFLGRKSAKLGLTHFVFTLVLVLFVLNSFSIENFSGIGKSGQSGGSDPVEIYATGATTICSGSSTTIAFKIEAGVEPFTVVYNNGLTDVTLNNYYPDVNETVSPTVSRTFTLKTVNDANNTEVFNGSSTVSISVNPTPSAIIVTTNPVAPFCPSVNFDLSASATNGNTYELWNAANSIKIADLPYTTSITSNTNYTVRAISDQGCTATRSYTAQLETTVPSITCPGNQTINPGAGTCIATIPDYRSLVTKSDNCTAEGSITLVQSPVSGTTLSGHGTSQLVTITATDAAGNSNSCNFTVTVADNINPQISCVGNQTVPASASCTYTHSGTGWNPSGANATDNCSVASVIYRLTGATNVAYNPANTSLNGVVFQPGTTTVTWRITDGAGNTAECSFDVSIQDSENPTVTSPGDKSANMAAGVCTYTHSGTSWNVTANDNCTVASISYVLTGATEGTILSTLDGAVFNKGLTNIAVTVSDGASPANTAICNYSVTISDNQNPTITCPSDISVNSDAGDCTAEVAIPNITFGDNCTGSSIAWSTSGKTILNGNGQIGTQTFNIGETTITVVVTDAASRTSQCEFTVTVTDNEDPTITCPADITDINDAGNCTASVDIPAVTFDDNCPGSTLAWSMSGVTGFSGIGQMGIQLFNVGETVVTYVVTDGATPANTTQCNFKVTITDTEKPTITCPDNIIVGNDINTCVATVAIPSITFGDNCSGSTITWTMTGVTSGSGSGQMGTKVFNKGVTTINVTVSDAASPANTESCSFTVTVNDTQKPQIVGCPANLTRSPDAGLCTATVSWTEPTATDNCTASGSLIWTKSHTPGSSFNAGTTTVTYYVTDAAGNESLHCSFDVTVTDNQKPIISGCPTNITKTVDAGQCGAVVTWTEPTATDNCTAQGSLIWTKSHTPG